MDRVAGLQDEQLLDDLQNDVGNPGAPVGTVALDATDVDVREVVADTALLRGDSDLGWRGVVIDL